MAFTPIGGVVMSTRSGDIDPGVATFLGRNEGMSADEVEEMLSKRAGLLGVSGKTSDMKTLLDAEKSDGACALAVEMYVYSIAKAIGAFAAALGGIDVLVFSGGIGERSPAIRARICERLDFLGVRIDAQRNASHADVISSGRVQVRVIPTNEELVIARAAYQLLGAS
jgi:acetate kinase